MEAITRDMEDKVLACLLKVTSFNAVASQHLQASYIENIPARNICKMALEFYGKYQQCLSDMAFVDGIKDLVRASIIDEGDVSMYVAELKRIKAIDITDYKYILDKLILFIKNRRWKKLIEDSVKKHMPKSDFDKIEKEASKIANITTLEDVKPYDYFSAENIAERTEIRIEEKKAKDEGRRLFGIGTGIRTLDDSLHAKGWMVKEEYIILAPPKRGKTMSMLSFANAAALQGFNVAYFSCEVSEEICASRLDANNSEIKFNELVDKAKSVSRSVKSISGMGKLLIYEYPTKSLTASMIDVKLRALEVEEGIKINILFVDYLQLLKPKQRYNDSWMGEGEIAEDLRGIASSHVIPVVTASQVNRAGAGKSLIKGTDTGGNFDKIAIADQIITLSATDEELKRNHLRIHLAESRNNPSATFTIETAFDQGTFYKGFVGYEY